MRLVINIAFVLFTNMWVFGQIPTASFTVDSDYCIDERILPMNTSSDAVSYMWDACPSNLGGDFTSSSLIDLDNTNNAFGLDIVFDNGNYYSFVTSRDNSRIFRLDFGDSLGNAPTVAEVIPTGDGVTSPYDIQVVEQSSNWYALVSNLNNTISIIDLGTDIENVSPSSVQYGSLGLMQPRGLVVHREGSNWIGIASNFNEAKITILNFGTDLGAPSITTIDHTVTGATQLIGLDMYSNGTTVEIAVASFNGNRIFRLSLDDFSDLTADIQEINEPTLGLNSPTEVSIINQSDSIYVYVLNINAGLSRLTYFNDFSNLERTELVGSGGASGFSNQLAMDFEKVGIDWRGLSMNFSNGVIFSFSFPDDCQDIVFDNTSLNQEQIQGLTYSSSGPKELVLFAFSADGTQRWVSNQFNVSGDVAPGISFTSDNVCINSLVTFSPSNSGLTSYSWDFNGDDIVDVVDVTGSNQSFDYSSLGTGTYRVRLDVSDGTCDNFFEQEITIYDPPPSPSYTFSSPRTCINTDYTFTNTTSDGSYVGPLSYLWEFIDEPSGMVVATADTRNAIYAFETEGQKTVRLTSSIPGCVEVTEQTIMITPGPTASFSATSVCQGESMQFTNNSADATIYSWDFGDGFMSSAENPNHVYTDAGNYFVTLIASDVEGCQDTEVVEVAVSDSPQINFDFDVPCTSSEGIQFTDFTTVNNADVVSWNWFVDGVEVSTDQNPVITFNSTGIKTIRLDVQGSNGCESSYMEDIEILASPTPDFSSSIGCQNEESTFMDITVASGNPIVSWLWSVEDVTYNTQDIVHVFENPGIFEVSLEVTAQNLCSEIITKMVEIIGLPSVNFSVNGECDNQLIQVNDQSTETEDVIVSRRWLLNGENVGNGEQLFLESLNNDSYELALELETSSGCIVSGTQSLEINTAPESSFTSSRTYGIPDDELTFTNTSTGSISHHWLLDGVVQNSNTTTQPITFPAAGLYEVGLVSENSLGCNDTITQEIIIAIPEVDLIIGSFELVEENGIGKIFLEIQNSSNLPVELTNAEVILENQFSVNEQVLAFIDIGETELVTLNVGIPLTVSEPSYFCVRLNSQYVDFPDVNPINNEKCLTIQPSVMVEDPFPNPVSDQFRLKVVLPSSDMVDVTVINSAGKIHKNEQFNAEGGLNNFFIDVSTLNPGIYFVKATVGEQSFIKRVLKR